MKVTLNGSATEVAEGTTVGDLVASICHSDRGVAVALDREVVPRSLWTETVVAEGSLVEVVTAVAGG